MDFSFNVKELFRDEITCVDNRLLPCRQQGIDRQGFQQLQSRLFEIIDKMGEASAKAQGLHGSITTGRKLEMSDHRLYLMTDANSNRGNGSVLGILKIGTKKLFVYDHSKAQHELEPLCVLDFYVHESRQRMGCGRKLFDFMLRTEGIPVQHLAIDRPSAKFLSFLSKHYSLKATVQQVNNFVIFEGFFNNRADVGNSRHRKHKSLEPGRQFGANNPTHRPPSGQRQKSHVSQYQSNPAHAHINSNSHGTQEEHFSKNILNNWVMPSPGRQPPSHMGAGDMMYSRHGATPPGGYHSNSSTPTRGLHPQEAMSANSGLYYKKLNGLSSPHTYYNTGISPGNYPSYFDTLPPRQTLEQGPEAGTNKNTVMRGVGGASSTPNFGNRSGTGNPSNSLHPANTRVTAPVVDPRYPPQNMQQAPPPAQLPEISANQHVVQSSGPPAALNLNQRPPSGKRNPPGHKPSEPSKPPLLQRDGPPANYTQMLNMHQNYQGRNGHLNIPQSGANLAVGELTTAKPVSQNTSWTVAGVLRDQRVNAPMSNRYYSSNRLW